MVKLRYYCTGKVKKQQTEPSYVVTTNRKNHDFQKLAKSGVPYTIFPHIRPAGIIFLQGLQLRVLLERGY